MIEKKTFAIYFLNFVRTIKLKSKSVYIIYFTTLKLSKNGRSSKRVFVGGMSKR